MALKTCKECGQQVSSRAKGCPSCGAPVRKGFGGCGCLAIIAVFVIAGLANPSNRKSSLTTSSKPNTTSQPKSPSQPKTSSSSKAKTKKESKGFLQGTVSKADYNKIKHGMLYSEVVGIIGKPGNEISSNKIDGVRGVMASVTTIMYEWHNVDGSNMNAIFQNSKLVQKAQFGLR